jgi:MoaA/NifB/PqqE/SkfB family radical SAM enzyme
MLENIYQIPSDQVAAIEWQGNDLHYDLQLYELGEGHDEFLVLTPDNRLHVSWNNDLKNYLYEIPDSRKCIVLTYNGDWIVKIFKAGWYPYHGYETVEIVKPKSIWSKNPEIDKLISFVDDPNGSYEPNKWERDYRLVWYIDPRFDPTGDKVWAMSVQISGRKILGTKDMGYLTPDVSIDYNEHLPNLGINVDECYPPFWELSNECAYELDPIHQTPELTERMWVVKFRPNWRTPKGWQWMGTISPEYHIVYNPVLPNLDYELDYVIPWHDLGYEHVWMLDRKHLNDGEADIWAFKLQVTPDPSGSKIIDYISPIIKIEHNPDLPKIKYDLDYTIPWHDLAYKHMWYLDNIGTKVWCIQMQATDTPSGEKEIGIITPLFADQLDVIFISYKESNAEENWQRVLQKAPWAKRVTGVEGIFNAHKAAAKLATTDMFFVVDGDAYLTDEWQFNFQPGIFDRDCAYVWHSSNPVNDLTYGYGGVKLFPRKALIKVKSWNTLDLFATVASKLKVVDTVSNITAFNTDEYSTWRSAFREVVKLCNAIKKDPTDKDASLRLDRWKTVGLDKPYGNYALAGAASAVAFFDKNFNTPQLQQINNGEWLYTMFKNEKPSVFNYKPIKIVKREEIVVDPTIYTKLEHSNPEHADWFVVNWCLGNTCNFSCSYCPKDLHDASIPWPELDVIKNFILKIKQAHPNKKLYFEFTGGEVTLYKHFIELCQFCTEQGVKVGLISNGSRTLRYWEENKQYFDHVCLSFHPEEADEKHFVEVVKILHNDLRTHVNIMMSPEKFDFCYAVANKVKNLGNISMALQPLIHDFGDTLYDYNEFQKKIFDKQHELIVKHIKYTKAFDYYRGAMVKLFPEGNRQVSSAQRFVSDKTNDWSGWKCYAGVEQLIVDKDGSIHRGWCKEGGMIGRITDPELNLSIGPVVCNSTMCHCNFDIMCTKEK